MARAILLILMLAMCQACSSLVQDLALGGQITTSGTHSGAAGEDGPWALIDGNLQTRWSSPYADNQWLKIDLLQSRAIGMVRLTWELAAARDYRVLLSDDGANWREAAARSGAGLGPRTDDLPMSEHARFIKVALDHRATQWGFSLYEVMVFAPLD